MNSNYDLIVILGPTASGKTRLAAALAAATGSAVISADSRQVYRGMNIGTGKDLDDYIINGTQVPYHLIDIADAGDKYDLNRFIRDFREAYEIISRRGKIPVLCGGTGLYIHAVLNNFSYPEIPVNEPLRQQLANKNLAELKQIYTDTPSSPHSAVADTSTVKRLIRAIEINYYIATHGYTQLPGNKLRPLVIGLKYELVQRRQMISERLKKRLDHGLIEEVKVLLDGGLTHEQLEYYGLEYKFISRYLRGLMPVKELEERLTIAIQQFAKRQMTYFRKMEREGIIIHWLNASEPFGQLLTHVMGLLP